MQYHLKAKFKGQNLTFLELESLKKVWDDLMVVLEFDPLSPCTMLIGALLLTSLLFLSTLVGWLREVIGLKKGSSYMYIIVLKMLS